MSVSFTEDQEELRRYARQWLDDRAPIDEVRRIMESSEGFDRDQWREMAELGWLGIATPEEYGGAGYGFAELAVLAEEMGRSLYPSPFLSSVVVGAGLVGRLGDDSQKRKVLGGIVSGSSTLAVAVPPFAEVDVEGERDGDSWLLSGSARFVLDGHGADTFLVAARIDRELRLFLVDGSAVETEPMAVMDLTRPQSVVRLEGARATELGSGEPREAIEGVAVRAVATLAMEQVGGAQECLEMSVAYAKERHQFGRPIGSFQAIKHMCADMLVAVESARSVAYHLANVVDTDPDEAAIAAPLAKSFCSETYFTTAADTIQIHGGIGFTWEHHAHLYLKRAKTSMLLFGDPTHHRSLLAARVGVE